MATGWDSTIYELIAKASTDLPPDVVAALEQSADQEEPGSNAETSLRTILENIELARQRCLPICQDTGSLLFWVEAPAGLPQKPLREAIARAIVKATEAGVLRQNCVDCLTGKNTGNNLGVGSPVVHWREAEHDTVKITLMLKGGGCENVGVQYSLPERSLNADRDLEGVRRCILDAVVRAQGKGCAPGILGVAIGGDRATGYAESKRQLLRRIGQRSQHPELAGLETRVCAQANELGIGPMGFGGKTTLLDVFIGALARVPASYFVSISYMCWAFRRQQIEASLDGVLVGER